MDKNKNEYLLKNEFMWEQPKKKKKLYKNWKLYAIAIPTIAAGAGAGAGIYYGVNSGHANKKVDLSVLKLNTNAIAGVENEDQETFFKAFLNQNSLDASLDAKVEVGAFTPPSYTKNGKLVVQAKAKSKYSGSVEVTISALGQVSLEELNKKEITLDVENMNETTAFTAFLANQTESLTDLKDNVTLELAKPSYADPGSLKIAAKPDCKYAGEVDVAITKLTKTALLKLGLKTTLEKSYTDQNDAFQAFLNLNSEVTDLKDNVEGIDFIPSQLGTPGSLTITALDTGKYEGKIDVTIPMSKIDLTSLNQEDLVGLEGMTDDDALTAFLDNNKEESLTNLKDNVTLEFHNPTYTDSGSLIITANEGTIYTGSITITIDAIGQKALIGLGLNLELGVPYLNENTAFQAFLDSNKTIIDLEANVEIEGFTPSSYGQPGALVVKGKTDGKYSGNVKVNFVGRAQINLADFNSTDILGVVDMTEDIALADFLGNNQTQDTEELKENVVLDFHKPTYVDDGALTIEAKPNSKYKGTITLKILVVAKTMLNGLGLNLGLTEPYTNQNDAFQAFLVLNSKFSDLEGNVEVSDFVAPDYTSGGSFKIIGTKEGKYGGEVDVKIPPLATIPLSDLNQDNLVGKNGMTQDDALNTFIANNQENSDLASMVDVTGFTAPGYDKTGSLTISGKENTKYTGEITLTIDSVKATDQEIVDVVLNSPISFGATMGLDQTLEDFIDGVIAGGEHDGNPHWYLEGQLDKYKRDYPILNQIDYDKFDFIGFYFSDETTSLTDNYIKESVNPKDTLNLRAKFSYGTVHEEFINFDLSFKEHKNSKVLENLEFIK